MERVPERRGEQGFSPAIETALRQERLGAKLARETAPACAAPRGRRIRSATYLERFEQAGVDQVIFVLPGGQEPPRAHLESLELFGAEVLPAFKERDEAQVRSKAARLAPAVEAAMDRRAREPGPPPPPPDYSFPALPRRWAGRDRQRGDAELARALRRRA